MAITTGMTINLQDHALFDFLAGSPGFRFGAFLDQV
jgi:hypothetical protein